ncbi:DUF501 domain-containing protein [Leucobacter sp. CSA1]|uniref:DUF501 domain-containing protein n=1 Tax=Leucobacter chromiisoli TaxID=2796471 RepID=A0A934Q6U0_9MICO|nr:DUF501 domain-containing protein [Leucobacter chromiisoli]MBK0418498.1 DUF501 domain-containing protein [Leucobacter chromiisoli]
MTRPPYAEPTAEDIRTVSEQLGREARGVVGIAARAADGSPTVVATAPRLPDGSPFPTFYYLCHPEVVAAASRLEAAGVMVEFNDLLAEDEEIRAQYERAHLAYIADRDSVGEVPEVSGVSAGGMPTRVKCLHALIGHSLAAGPGVNPIGDLALERSGWAG